MINKMLFKLFVLMIFFTMPVYAAVYTADGYGKDETEARANATAELSFILYSDVKSEISTTAGDSGGRFVQEINKQVDITSAVPVFGASYKIEQVDAQYKVSVKLDSATASASYIKAANTELRKINKLTHLISSEESESKKYQLVMAAISSFENFNKLRGVLNVFGEELKSYPNITFAELVSLRDRLTKSTDSLELAAKLISSELAKPNTYIYYPMYNSSDEVTEFSILFRDMLIANIKPAANIHVADYLLETDYSVTGAGIFLTATLTDKNGVVEGKSVKKLEPKSYAGLKVKPQSLSFEKLLKLGLVSSADFSARISTDRGKKAMLYRLGDAVELFIKLNKPGYFFLVGHVDKDGERFSYIVDFYEAKGNRKFIRHVDGDEINRWISIGEFDIVPPFGLETFQMIATVKDPVNLVPANVFDSETELYIVSKDIKEGVAKTRALKKRKDSIDAVAEDVLVFSTIEK